METAVIPEEATEYLNGRTFNNLLDILDFFHKRYPNEEVWPHGTVLPDGLIELSLGGGTLPDGTILPEGITALLS